MKAPKIDIYINGRYICTTEQSKTPKDAVARIKKNPYYAGSMFLYTGQMDRVPDGVITARYAK